MRVVISRVLPIYPHRVFVQWTLDNPENSAYTFKVYRAGSPSGPFEQVSDEIPDYNFFYMDQDVPQLNLLSRSWYVVEAIPATGPDNSSTSVAQTVAHTDQKYRSRIGRKARYDLGITLRRLNGVRVLAVKRRRYGARCKTCYSEQTKDAIISHCIECYGTSFTGGYHDPVAMWAKLDPAVVTERMDTTGLTDAAMFSATVLDYPLLEAEDLLVETRTNRRFRIRQKIPSESSRITVHQDLQISELSRADVAYTVPLDLVE